MKKSDPNTPLVLLTMILIFFIKKKKKKEKKIDFILKVETIQINLLNFNFLNCGVNWFFFFLTEFEWPIEMFYISNKNTYFKKEEKFIRKHYLDYYFLFDCLLYKNF